MDIRNGRRVNYHNMAILALIVGIVAIALQFMGDFELMSFFLTMAALGGLIAGGDSYEERDRQQLERSYKKAFEWLLLIVMAIYAFIEFSRLFAAIGAAVALVNDHWPGLILCFMCVAMGIAGLQKARPAGSA